MKIELTTIVMLFSIIVSAQEQNREQVLIDDITRLGERAARDRVITEEKHRSIIGFVCDSLPEDMDKKIQVLEQIRSELDEQYAEMVRNSQKTFDESTYIGSQMLPGILYKPDGFISPEEKVQHSISVAKSGSAIDKKELLKYVKPLPMKPWLRTILRLLFGIGVNQSPQRGDYTVVPQMGGLYNIITPGGRPDDSWRDAPEMYYDPHPDKHFRR